MIFSDGECPACGAAQLHLNTSDLFECPQCHLVCACIDCILATVMPSRGRGNFRFEDCKVAPFRGVAFARSASGGVEPDASTIFKSQSDMVAYLAQFPRDDGPVPHGEDLSASFLSGFRDCILGCSAQELSLAWATDTSRTSFYKRTAMPDVARRLGLRAGSEEFKVDYVMATTGSPLVGWRASIDCKVPFTGIHINDNDARLLDAAYSRLKRIGAPVSKYGGEANLVAARLAAELNPHGLHFALLDPFNLVLPMEVIRSLSQLKRIDLLIHVSAMDLQRNWGRYTQQKHSPLDEFAPGWRESVDLAQPEESARLSFIQYWVDLLKQLGFDADVRFELITGSKNQPLYWLVLVAKHEIAMKFWKTAAQHGKTQQMF